MTVELIVNSSLDDQISSNIYTISNSNDNFWETLGPYPAEQYSYYKIL